MREVSFHERVQLASKKIKALPLLEPTPITITNKPTTTHQERVTRASKKIRALPKLVVG